MSTTQSKCGNSSSFRTLLNHSIRSPFHCAHTQTPPPYNKQQNFVQVSPNTQSQQFYQSPNNSNNYQIKQLKSQQLANKTQFQQQPSLQQQHIPPQQQQQVNIIKKG